MYHPRAPLEIWYFSCTPPLRIFAYDHQKHRFDLNTLLYELRVRLNRRVEVDYQPDTKPTVCLLCGANDAQATGEIVLVIDPDTDVDAATGQVKPEAVERMVAALA